jgi:hypothetical protein
LAAHDGSFGLRRIGGLKGGSAFMVDPAAWALVFGTDLEPVFEKTLGCEACRLALRLYFQLQSLYLLKLRLEYTSAILQVGDRVSSFL